MIPLLLSLAAGTAQAENATHYQLDVAIEPATHQLTVSAIVELPPEFAGRTVEFLLTSALQIDHSEPRAQRLPYEQGGFTGINGSSVVLGKLDAIARYRVALPEGSSTLKLSYGGTVNFPLSSPEEEYARGIIETAGTVKSDGVYLAGGTLWYPYFSDELVSFELTAAAPDGWRLISQGNGSSNDPNGQAHWDSGGLVDEIYLVGGPLTLYEAPAGAVEAQAYLRRPEPALAERYLSATARYIEMYRSLIGPYPYGKFALIENFWETGYGMPSFTLLGPMVIRFPFILTSSYPHEILHNWWGNSVFVDYPTGNWCEGLTAYMADHLMKEQAGQAAEYRRDTLKKYRDFVRDGRDFPLTEFRSRHSAATEAVGYGKTLMGFHMLRRQLGDEAFTTALARFYREHRGSKASFGDIRAQLEQVSGRDLKPFFEQWVELPGAADLRLDAVEVRTTNGGFRGDRRAAPGPGRHEIRTAGAAVPHHRRWTRDPGAERHPGSHAVLVQDRLPAAVAGSGPAIRPVPAAGRARNRTVDRPGARRPQARGRPAGSRQRSDPRRIPRNGRTLAKPHAEHDDRARRRPR